MSEKKDIRSKYDFGSKKVSTYIFPQTKEDLLRVNVTEQDVINWNYSYSVSHTHTNKVLLDSITSLDMFKDNFNEEHFEGDGSVDSPISFLDKSDDRVYGIKNGEYEEVSQNIDGGDASSVYLVLQVIDGGGA